ncbi:MAG: DUF6020 family protein [Lachnospiraceae bacterium]|nr:DUF6020 family protein [Lachnospiraceae bacterium]
MAKRIIAVVLALVYSVLYAIVGPMIESQDLSFKRAYILPFTICLVLGIIFNLLIFSIIPNKKAVIQNSRIFQSISKADKHITKLLDSIGNRRFLFITWGFILLAWIPVYLMVYPGVLSYDTLSQTGSALATISSNHHPVLHTWLIRVFMRFGERMLGGYEYGIGVYSLVQMIVLSYALARLTVYLKKKKIASIIVLIVAIGSALWFENAMLSVTMTKDVFHSAFLLLFVCHYTDIVSEPMEYVTKKSNLFIFPVVSFLMCAFRNNGIHIFIFCFAILLILRIKSIKNIKKYLILIPVVLIPIVLFEIYSGPFFKVMGIQQGEVRETLCVPIQQLQRVAVTRADELTEEQTDLMNYYIDNLNWREWKPGREYDPFFADPAKSSFYSAHYDENPVAFWRFYLKTGKQFTKDYVVAFLSNTLGYWYPGYYGYSYVMYDNYDPELFVVPLERKAVLNAEAITNFYKSMCLSDRWRDIYVVRLFFVPGFSAWLLIYSIIIAWKDKRFITKKLPMFLPMIAQFGIMLLSPMSSFRYSWPLYLMLPIVLIAVCGKKGEANEEKIQANLGDINEGE